MSSRGSAEPASSVSPSATLRDALDRGDTDTVTALLTTDLWSLLDENAESAYQGFNAIPADALTNDPALAVVRALCLVMAAPYELTDSAPPALLAANASSDPTTALFARMLQQRFSGAHCQANAAADRLRARVNERIAMPSTQEGTAFGLYLVHAGTSALLAGDLAQALTDLHSAGIMARRYGANLIHRDVTAKSAIVHGLSGRISQVEPTLSGLGEPPTDPILRQYMHDSNQLALAIRAVERLDPDARQRVDALDLLDPVNELWPIVLLLRGRLALAEGTPTRVFDEISMALGSHTEPQDGLGNDVIRALRIHAFTAVHESAAGLALAENTPPEWALFTRIARLEAFAAAGRGREAALAARATLVSASAPAVMRDQALLVIARTLFDEHETVDASTALGIYSPVVREGKRRAVLWLPEPVLRAIADALPETQRGEFLAAVTGLPVASERQPAPELSPAELRVLRAIANAQSVSATAEQLYVSENTVKTHLSAIYRKFGVHGRAEAIREAARFGMLGPWGAPAESAQGTVPPTA